MLSVYGTKLLTHACGHIFIQYTIGWNNGRNFPNMSYISLTCRKLLYYILLAGIWAEDGMNPLKGQ